MQKKTKPANRLLKKASPDPQSPPSRHPDGLTVSFTCERPALRRNTEAQSFHEKGRTALLEMPVSNPLPCHASCHRRKTTRRTKTRERLARPMEHGDLLQIATGASSEPKTLLLNLLLLLYRRIRHPSSSLRHPAQAPASRAAGSGGLVAATFKGGAVGGASREGKKRPALPVTPILILPTQEEEAQASATRPPQPPPLSASPTRSPRPAADLRAVAAMAEQQPLPEVEQLVTSIPEDHEATCWGCGLRLVFTSYAPVYKCGWCGAVTQCDQTSRKPDSVCFSRWRRFRDGFFVTVLILFMLFVICGGVWAVYPVVFSISMFCGIFHCTVAAVLAVFTIASYCLASLKSAGMPATIRWGSYPMVGKNDLENYTFCTYCSKPKPPRAHHCRSCKMCVVDMDHHCPFIGNCVGASNHRAFVIFLLSVVTSCSYAAIMTIYASYHIWPPLHFPNLSSYGHSKNSMKVLVEIITTLASSAFFLSARGIILLYLAFASLSVNAGIAVLLCQQLSYIYEGNTYLTRLSSPNVTQGERGLQNLVRFFGCPYPFSRVLLGYLNKSQDNSGSKLL